MKKIIDENQVFDITELNGDFIIYDLDDYARVIINQFEKLGMTRTFDKIEDESQWFALNNDHGYYMIETKKFKIFNFKSAYPHFLDDLNYTKEQMQEVMRIGDEMGFNGMTIGRSAYNIWLNQFGGKYFTFGKYPKLCAEKWNEDDLFYILKGYKGGLNVYNKKYEGKILKKVYSLDANSAYSKVAKDYPLPVGIPQRVKYEDVKDHDFECGYVRVFIFKAKLKPGHIATWFYKDVKKQNVYFDEIENFEDYLWLTEFEDLKKDYDIEYEIQDGMDFMTEKHIFDNYIDHFMKVKMESTGYKKMFAKCALNHLWGKFATRPEYVTLYKNETIVKENKKYYCALTSFINAMTRVMIRRVIRNLPDPENDFVLSKTDSTKTLDYDFITDQKKLGMFKIENVASKFCVLNAFKYAYVDLDTKELEIVVNGYNGRKEQNKDFKIEDFKTGTKLNATRKVRDENGVHFEDYSYEL